MDVEKCEYNLIVWNFIWKAFRHTIHTKDNNNITGLHNRKEGIQDKASFSAIAKINLIADQKDWNYDEVEKVVYPFVKLIFCAFTFLVIQLQGFTKYIIHYSQQSYMVTLWKMD